MLIGAEPRGLPGTTIDRVEFQRAAEGHPLDDVVVHAHDRHGNNAVLEIQVKRTVRFAPSDREFIARMFMHDGWEQPARCYLHFDGAARVDPLLIGLQRLAESGPCFFVALNLLEVAPRPSQLGFVVAVAEAWLDVYPDNSDLWRDQRIGKRICDLIDTIRGHQPSILSRDTNLRERIDKVLVYLTNMGVPEAAVLEQELANAEA